jgi:cytochrome c oxidase assembly protein subunit 15
MLGVEGWQLDVHGFLLMKGSPTSKVWLHRFAVLTALATLALIGIGGLVTSHEAGMSVPDWPTSNGYNMFAFPLSQWWHVGNVFYEHSHRLFASGVGLLTTLLAIWLWLKESRAWLRWLGVMAFFAVVLQGVLGGLRVVMFKDQIGIFHAMLAQLFFVLTCAIALFTSKWWQKGCIQPRTSNFQRPLDRVEPRTNALGAPGSMFEVGCFSRGLHRLFLFTTILIFLQLILGATMRHQHAGLAIPDFPLAYGKLWPATDSQSVARYNQQRMEINAVNPITPFQIKLQMAHRVMAVLILFAVAAGAWWARRDGAPVFDPARVDASPKRAGPQAGAPIRWLAFLWLALILLQASLGAATVWWNKAADIATAHVLVGALSLANGVLLCIIATGFDQESVRQPKVFSNSDSDPENRGSFAATTSAH